MKLTNTERLDFQPGKNTFIVLRKEMINGKRKTKKVEIPELKKINELLNSGFLPLHEAKKQIKVLVNQLQETEREKNKPSSTVFLGNKKLVEKYLDTEYSHRDLIDPQSIKNDFYRAINILGNNISLLTSSQTEIQKQVNKELKAQRNKQRRTVNRLNTLLKFANRGFKLQRFKEEFVEPNHVSEKELIDSLDKSDINDSIKLIIKLGFYTGCRFAEIFALKETDIWEGFIQITYQKDRLGKIRQTKTRKKRKAIISKVAKRVLGEWFSLPIEVKNKLYEVRYGAILTNLLGRRFVFHDLRHSYARHLCNNDISLKHVADSLGNSILVCEKYYAGWISEDEVLTNVAARLDKV